MRPTKKLIFVAVIGMLWGCQGFLTPAGNSPFYLPIPAVVFRAGDVAERPAEPATPAQTSERVTPAQDPPGKATAKPAQSDKVAPESIASATLPAPSQIGAKKPDTAKPRPADFF